MTMEKSGSQAPAKGPNTARLGSLKKSGNRLGASSVCENFDNQGDSMMRPRLIASHEMQLPTSFRSNDNYYDHSSPRQHTFTRRKDAARSSHDDRLVRDVTVASTSTGLITPRENSGSGSKPELESGFESESESQSEAESDLKLQPASRQADVNIAFRSTRQTASLLQAPSISRSNSTVDAKISQKRSVQIARLEPNRQPNISVSDLPESSQRVAPRLGHDNLVGQTFLDTSYDPSQAEQSSSRHSFPSSRKFQQVGRNTVAISVSKRSKKCDDIDLPPGLNKIAPPTFPNLLPTFTRGPTVQSRRALPEYPPTGSTPDSDPSTFPFTVLNDVVLQDFVRILPHEFGERIMYLSRRVELLQSEFRIQAETALLAQAIEFSKTHKEIAAVNCCLSLALIRYSGSQHMNTISQFFKNLDTTGSAEKRELRVLFEQVQRVVKTEALKVVKTNVQNPMAPNNPQPNNDITSLSKLSRRDGNFQHIAADSASDPLQFYNPAIREKLIAAYKKRNGNKWFVEGKVFAILWHEAVDESNKKKGKAATDYLMDPREGEKMRLPLDPNHSPALFKSTVASHIRRMVVIRNKHGYCWCVAIGTYGGLGLRKNGLTREDINAHTIVYDSEAEPTVLKQEPVSEKRPIAINLVEGATLHPASRLHAGKPYSVEWNVKVMDVGQVTDDDIEVLKSYVKQEIFG